MRIACLHLDLAAGPRERNQEKLLSAMALARACGADWIVTPETALEGYFFYKLNEKNLDEVPSDMTRALARFIRFAKETGAVLFLSGAEKEEKTGSYYNTCFAIDERGIRFGHRKMFSHQTGSEGWLALGQKAEVYEGFGLRAGVLVCADAYYEEPVKLLKEEKADLILVSAAWPPGECCKDPVAIWKRTSLRGGVPVCICNQTGNYCGMDMTIAKSALVHKGELLFSYEGNEAILLFDFNERKKEVVSPSFTVIPFGDKEMQS